MAVPRFASALWCFSLSGNAAAPPALARVGFGLDALLSLTFMWIQFLQRSREVRCEALAGCTDSSCVVSVW